MANVKQIKINDTVYDVEDSVARSALEQKAPLESPALTGIPPAPTASMELTRHRLLPLHLCKMLYKVLGEATHCLLHLQPHWVALSQLQKRRV